MRKNKIVQVVFLYLMLLMCGCTTNTTDNSLMFGENGSPKIVIGDFQASKADIHSVLMKVLRERRWNVLDDGNPIVVEQLNGSQHAETPGCRTIPRFVRSSRGRSMPAGCLSFDRMVLHRGRNLLRAAVRKNTSTC